MTHAGYFEGIGGFSLGAERAGIKTIYTCEFDEFRHNWLKHYLPHATHEKDINEAKGCYADIFTAGFPCQDISSANPRGEGIHGKRSGLFFVFMEHVCSFRPRYVCLENSPNVISKRYLLDILRPFAEIGYNAEWQVISKHPLGYPDERRRFILVAYSNEERRKTSKCVFERESFKICLEAQKQNEFILNKLSRRDSALDWRNFISGVLQNASRLPKELVKKQIEAYGDAICPDVAQLVFELIKIHEKR